MLCFLVLAAGKSTRMKSKTSKILYPLQDKPLIEYVLEQIPASQEDIFIVSNISYKNYTCIPQSEPLGTGHAVFEALKYIPDQYTDVVILCGDTPLITRQTLDELKDMPGDLSLIGFQIIGDLTKSYGRIINNGERIKEYKDASLEEKNNPYVYAGVMKIKRVVLEETLPQLKPHPEFYLTEIFEKTQISRIVLWKTEEEFLGVNTKEDLALVEQLLQKRLKKNLMLEGVVFYNPESSNVYHNTKISRDVVIEPHVHIGKNVIIEEDVVIHSFSYLENCHIKKGSHIGPFAHIKGESVIGERSVIGNFVEIKNTQIGYNTKVKHLSYLGDAIIKEDVNIGAGTVICNYDGFAKHTTMIKKGAFVGSNSTLISPITVHEKAYVGAGSVITEDIEAYDLVFTRAQRKEKKKWVKKKMGSSSSVSKNSPKLKKTKISK